MKRILLTIVLLFSAITIFAQGQKKQEKAEQTIFAFGGDINPKFVQYIVDLTKKSNPKICYLPTASADNEDHIKYWNNICKNLSIEPYVLRVWVNSQSSTKTFEEILLDMDAIVVGGGNTLNMLAIWKAQGIDTALKKALEKGIVLAGGSAGSICWFKNGISDSRPVQLSVVEGLGFLPYSNCPHYGDSAKKELYHRLLKEKKIEAGYAFDDRSASLFINGKYVKSVSLNDSNNSYRVALKKGVIDSEKLHSEIIVKKGALVETAYTSTDVRKKVKDYSLLSNQDNPLNAYVSIIDLLANGELSKMKHVSSHSLQNRLGNLEDKNVSDKDRNRFLNTEIIKVLIYNDAVAGVINKMYDAYYGLWYFCKENGRWLSAGEDIGGDTELESEITFREKAEIHMQEVRKFNSGQQ